MAEAASMGDVRSFSSAVEACAFGRVSSSCARRGMRCARGLADSRIASASASNGDARDARAFGRANPFARRNLTSREPRRSVAHDLRDREGARWTIAGRATRGLSESMSRRSRLPRSIGSLSMHRPRPIDWSSNFRRMAKARSLPRARLAVRVTSSPRSRCV
ncbi:conserved hypothetical protein [Burkholderia pseudomallei 668]|nr:conserved hypothetical protein [Burkholderia pseudomallei 668]